VTAGGALSTYTVIGPEVALYASEVPVTVTLYRSGSAVPADMVGVELPCVCTGWGLKENEGFEVLPLLDP
jgi:hypothetical protein